MLNSRINLLCGAQGEIEMTETQPTKQRFNVTMTWDDWPSGGSYGTIVEAANYSEAEELCRAEMAACREDENRTAQDVLAEYEHDWHVVDCFPLNDFIKRHTGPTTPQRLVITVRGGVAELEDSENLPEGMEIFIVDYDCEADDSVFRFEGKPAVIEFFKAGADPLMDHTGHFGKLVQEDWANG